MHFVLPLVVVVCLLFWIGLFFYLPIKVFLASIALIAGIMILWFVFDTYNNSNTGHTVK